MTCQFDQRRYIRGATIREPGKWFECTACGGFWLEGTSHWCEPLQAILDDLPCGLARRVRSLEERVQELEVGH